jgi:UDP-N-acetylmuramate--alanine ligase
MITLDNIKRAYFLGIGGIGMSAIARYMSSKGIIVSGYDKTATELTGNLSSEGMEITYDDDLSTIDKDADIIVYTPAIPSNNIQLNYFKENNYPLYKRSEVLGLLTQDTFNICIAGTHGKTTISTMIAHILRDTGVGCNAFLGGISVNYNTNFWSSENKTAVVEADEYDRSFLRLSPDVAVISAMDADHLDIYGTEEALQDAFIQFSQRVKAGGTLITKFGLHRSKEFIAASHLEYSLQNTAADIYAEDITVMNGSYYYNVKGNDWLLEGVRLNIGGMHNVENSVAAIAIAKSLNIDDEKIKNAVSNFKGVRRRFEYVISPQDAAVNTNNIVFIDDYAHHPEELRSLITSAKHLFNGRKCTVIFQPHLFTRTRDLAQGFGESLQLADEVILLPIYPARELPIEGVSSEMILRYVNNENKRLMNKEELLQYLGSTWLENASVEERVLITAGAGDIDHLVGFIKQIIAPAI